MSLLFHAHTVNIDTHTPTNVTTILLFETDDNFSNLGHRGQSSCS